MSSLITWGIIPGNYTNSNTQTDYSWNVNPYGYCGVNNTETTYDPSLTKRTQRE